MPRRHHVGTLKLWAFCVEDLAIVLGENVRSVRALISKGALDPTDLSSIVAAVNARSHGPSQPPVTPEPHAT